MYVESSVSVSGEVGTIECNKNVSVLCMSGSTFVCQNYSGDDQF
jgi:hypothetical protein